MFTLTNALIVVAVVDLACHFFGETKSATVTLLVDAVQRLIDLVTKE